MLQGLADTGSGDKDVVCLFECHFKMFLGVQGTKTQDGFFID